MERNTISEMAKKLETKQDLLVLLNHIKRDVMEGNGMSDKFCPFTMKHINYYCNPKNAFHRFRQFEIKKKTGGFRVISTPRNNNYMMLLSCVNEMLKAIYTPSKYAMGFTEGRSVVTNANVHKGMNYILNWDMKDFFPSIEQPRVWKRLQLKPFEFPLAIANVIAGLVSMKETREMPDGSKKDFYVLPQGAPTSPIITNMICDNLDRRLGGLAKRFGLNYTRYADDITFSSMHSVYKSDGEFYKELCRIIADQGFTVNEGKKRLQKLGSRQEVTGIVVSDKLNVTQKYVRDIRNILYLWDRYGYDVAFSKFVPKYKQEKGHVKKGNPDLINVLDGKLMYLKMVKGETDSVYVRLYSKFKKLADEARSMLHTNCHAVTYVETKTLADFEKQTRAVVEFVMTEPSKDNEAGIEVRAKRYAYFVLDNKIYAYASISKDIAKSDLQQKELLSISSCRDAHDTPFWLIHKSDKVTVSPVEAVDVDALNEELDNLLNM